MNRSALIFPLALCLAVAACDKKDSPAPAMPATTPSVAPKVAAPEAPVVGAHLKIATVKSSFLIDAPLEKIKGTSEEGKGELALDPLDLTKSRGEVAIRLAALHTHTFGDKSKDDSQTEHAHNWMEIGPESSAENKVKYEYTKLTIKSVETPVTKLADIKEEGGARTFKAKVGGDLWIHGVTSAKTVAVTVTVKGPPDAPTEVMVKTDEPMMVSMKEHGIAPHDKLGGFLNGALEKIGKKIDDKVQVSFEATAKK